MMDKTYNILFLCNRNSARSIIAEALAITLSHGLLVGHSAGANPSGFIHPFAIDIIKSMGYPVQLLRSKSWDEFGREGSTKMDFIITLCDSVAGEKCPYWPGHPSTAHWGFPDPAVIDTTDVNGMQHAFKQIEIGLRNRIELLMDLPMKTLDRLGMQEQLHKIHQSSKCQ